MKRAVTQTQKQDTLEKEQIKETGDSSEPLKTEQTMQHLYCLENVFNTEHLSYTLFFTSWRNCEDTIRSSSKLIASVQKKT